MRGYNVIRVKNALPREGPKEKTMKKLIAVITALCLMLCVFAGCGGSKVEYYDEDAADTAEAASAPEAAAAEPAEAPAEEEPLVSIGQGGTGFESFPADMVVANINGRDVTWMEYYYWLNYYTQYVIQFAAQYGLVLTDWDGLDLSGTNTNADVVIMNAQANLIQDYAVITGAEDLGVAIDEEDEASLQATFEEFADQQFGDADGTASDDEITMALAYITDEMHVDREFFDQFNATGLLSQKTFEAQYGAEGEKYSDEDTLAFAEDNGLLGAKHILLMTVDADTREPLSDEEIAEKRAVAEAVLAQLQAVQDDPDALAALFDQLMAEYTEDTGFAAYPDGYVFSEGEMVQEFEDGVKALEVGGLSGIVESDYGFHIILRIPIEPDAVIGTNANGEDVTLRYAAATQQYSAELSAWTDAAEVVWSEGFEHPDMAAIFG